MLQGDRPDMRRLDVGRYLHTAQKLARQMLPDAQLTHMFVNYVYPNGRADLTLGSGGMASFVFRSKQASVRGDTPVGVALDCKAVVSVMPQTGVYATLTPDHKCEDPIVGLPRCSPTEVWRIALNRGAPQNGVAQMIYSMNQGRRLWVFIVGDFTSLVEDDCGAP